MSTISVNSACGSWAHVIPGQFVGDGRTAPPGDVSRRVPWLLGLVLGLSLVDLALTVGHMQTIGMVEANPLVHLLLRLWNSGWMVVIFKLATLAIGVGTLFALRRHWQTEIATWLIMLIFAGVCIIWVQYLAATAGIDGTALAAVMRHEPGWIRFD